MIAAEHSRSQGLDTDPAVVHASVHFLKADTRHHEEKPYAFHYALDNADCPQSNMEMEKAEGIPMMNLRGREHEFTLEKNGFAVLRHQSALEHGEYYDPSKLGIYFRELEDLLKAHFNASRVEVFRHGVRRRHPDFPISTGKAYEYDQPTSVAHIDTTPQEAVKEIQRQYGAKAPQLLTKRSQWMNIWKPLKGPLNDWPLAICDASTVQREADLEAADLLYPDLATENYQVYFRPHYKWYYLSDHMPSELIVFKQADSWSGQCPGILPRGSSENVAKGEEPRQSIEARALVLYDD